MSEEARTYYMLECFEPDEWDDHALVRLVNPPPSGFTWSDGTRFPFEVTEPVEFVMRASHSDDLLEMHNAQGMLITKRLLTALRQAGVDNMDAYDATVRHETMDTVRNDYVAVNLIGTVAAANLGQSTILPGGLPGNLIDVDFAGVVIESSKAEGLLMFRLAENTNAIVVHERVKIAIEGQGFTMLTFVPPESWMG